MALSAQLVMRSQDACSSVVEESVRRQEVIVSVFRDGCQKMKRAGFFPVLLEITKPDAHCENLLYLWPTYSCRGVWVNTSALSALSASS